MQLIHHTLTYPPIYLSTYLHYLPIYTPPGGDGGRGGILRGRFRARGGQRAHALLGLEGQRVGEVRLYCMLCVCLDACVSIFVIYLPRTHTDTPIYIPIYTSPRSHSHTRTHSHIIHSHHTYLHTPHARREHYREEETGRDMAHLNLTALLIHFGEQHLQVGGCVFVCVCIREG